ncbi:unnamed protein product [Diplocarpon coronariae]|uniref:Sugar ABC transporter substrate-binding protein n=1 Tax=Diplocarpon coronariae TaxID=2795749 RepID=A0A218YWI7_9HELO|nr:hypothetical protein JHW43_003184 [Diplocarpon mali]OWO99821.1 sugar ABC transporter substrate-binding protein [Marssonina coronariae]
MSNSSGPQPARLASHTHRGYNDLEAQAGLPGFENIELNEGRNPLPRMPQQANTSSDKKTSRVLVRHYIDGIKSFCEKNPGWAWLILCLFLSALVIGGSGLIMASFVSMLAPAPEMTDELRDAINHIPGFSEGIHR